MATREQKRAKRAPSGEYGAYSVGDVRITGMLSTASTGLSHSDNTLYYSGTVDDGVVIGLDIYLNTGQPVAGSRLRIWGRRKPG